MADNREAARNFHHDWATYDGVEVIGRSKHAQSLIDEGRLGSTCSQAGGISIQVRTNYLEIHLISFVHMIQTLLTQTLLPLFGYPLLYSTCSQMKALE